MEESEKITKEEIVSIVNSFIDMIDYAIDIDVKEEDGKFFVQMTGDNLGILIGYHGKNIPSIEHLLNLMIYRLHECGKCIFLDVNDYKKGRIDVIKKYTENAIKQVQITHEDYDLNDMPANERLVVHEYAKSFKNISTLSQGEEPKRHVRLSFSAN